MNNAQNAQDERSDDDRPDGVNEESGGHHDVEATDVARILPSAVRISSRRGGGLADALRPVVEKAVAASVRTDPSRLADTAIPVVGLALRRAAGRCMLGLVRAVNLVVFSLFTIRGWRWRFESMRTGRSFEEVARRHTATWPVKQVLLIHRRTGLLLAEVRSPLFASRDSDMVSGMLTAIQDFMRDSFPAAHPNEKGELRTIEVGGSTVWVEPGPLATIAAVIEGHAPPQLRPAFEEALTTIHKTLGREMQDFDGDTAPYERSRPALEACVDLRAPGSGIRILPLTWLLLAALVAVPAAWLYRVGIERHRWAAYTGMLEQEPGLVVTATGRRDGRRFVAGLRDPLARDPGELLAAAKLDAAGVVSRWHPYYAMETVFTMARARRALEPPPTVVLACEDGVLRARGTAPSDWIKRAEAAVDRLPCVSSFDASGVRTEFTDRQERWERYLAALEGRPGVIVIETGRRDGRFYVAGLRDPLAADPMALLADAGLEPSDVIGRWEPYQALDSRVVLRRAEQVLRPPSGVELSVADGVLSVTGRAPHEWIVQVEVLARTLPGMSRVDMDELVDVEAASFEDLRKKIDGEVFRFLEGTADLWPLQKKRVEGITRDIGKLYRLGRRLGRPVSIRITGHTTSSDDPRTDDQVGMGVARRVLSVLELQGLRKDLFSLHSVVEQRVAGGAERYVTLRVVIADE